ncbi:MAG TPA: S8 family serine peptidase [Saprospiraceae bacterium]|nr:S8 family serine peptidase [Saprospiraceae bacterium]
MISFPITAILLLASFGLWVIHYKNKNLLFLSIILAVIHGIVRFFSALIPATAFLLISLDLLLLGLFSLALIYFRKNIFLQWGIYALTVGALVYHQFGTDEYNKFEVDREWEILLQTDPNHHLTELKDFIRKYQLESKTAFKPTDENATDLDDYWAIGIPNKSEKHIKVIRRNLEKLPGVLWIEYNELYEILIPDESLITRPRKMIMVNDPLTEKQWAMTALHADDYLQWIQNQQIAPKHKAKVFILDSGIESGHEDLEVMSPGNKKDYHIDKRGHGTHVAGIAGAISNNGKGIASLIPGPDWIELNSIKVINDIGFGTQKDIINGIIEAVDQGADVINLSLGARSYQNKEKAYKKAIDYAVRKKVIVIAAAGNSSGNARDFVPANLDQVITVAAVDYDLRLASFSNHVRDVSFGLSAPGVDILSTFTGNTYKPLSGTSMAAPFISGFAGVLKALDPDLDHEDVYRVIHESGSIDTQKASTGTLLNPVEALRILKKETLK